MTFEKRTGVFSMKIALASAPVKNRNIEFNMQVMIDAMSKIRDQADVIVFGESVLQGFDSLCWDYEKDKHMAVTLTDAQFSECAKQQSSVELRYHSALLSALRMLCTAVKSSSALTARS
jgi:predicted amidohydrolase